MRALVWRWGPAVVVMAIIFTASSTPAEDLPHFGLWDTLVKKAGHAFGYGLLAAAYLRGLRRDRPIAAWMLPAALGLALAYALSDEFHQLFVPGRSASPTDVGIDAVGACLGLAVRVILQTRIQSPRRSTRPPASA